MFSTKGPIWVFSLTKLVLSQPTKTHRFLLKEARRAGVIALLVILKKSASNNP